MTSKQSLPIAGATGKVSIADVLREGFEATKKNSNSVLPLFVTAQAVVFLLQYLSGASIFNLLMIPVVLMMQIVIFRSFRHPHAKFDINGILDLKDKDLKPTLWKLFITNLIYIVLLALLFLLLVIPGIIFMVYWFVFSYVVLDHGISGMEALKKSKAMITGNWWRTFALVLISAVITIIASSIVSGISAGNNFISGLLMSIISGVISVYFGYVAVAYYFGLKR